MGMVINGEHVADQVVEEEFNRLRAVHELQRQPGVRKPPPAENLRLMAACAVVDRVIIRQVAEKDPRPIDRAAVEVEMREQLLLNNCRTGVNEASMRQLAEQGLRIKRTTDELCGAVEPPSTDEVMEFYRRFQGELGTVDKAEAAHVIVHVRATRPEKEARDLIEAAQRELERGVPFAEVAERFSDCKGGGGDIGIFERGVMVDEFDNVVFALKPGERSDIFRTPFGFHIAELRSLSPGSAREPGVAQREIEAYLTAKRRHEAMQRGLERLRDEAVIGRVEEPGLASR